MVEAWLLLVHEVEVCCVAVLVVEEAFDVLLAFFVEVEVCVLLAFLVEVEEEAAFEEEVVVLVVEGLHPPKIQALSLHWDQKVFQGP